MRAFSVKADMSLAGGVSLALSASENFEKQSMLPVEVPVLRGTRASLLAADRPASDMRMYLKYFS